MSDSKKFELSPSISILVAGVLIAAAIVFVNLNPATPVAVAGDTLPANVHVTPPVSSEHIVGSASAPIVLVEYSDFQCPYCSMVYPTLKKIVSESNGQIAWVMRNYPLESIHPQAKPAAIAAECITEQLGNDGFWKFADTVFANQGSMNPAYYAQLAAQFGANPATYASCVSSEKPYALIQQEAAEAGVNGGNGTPFTVIVGSGLEVPVSGAQPYANFVAVINAIKSRQQ